MSHTRPAPIMPKLVLLALDGNTPLPDRAQEAFGRSAFATLVASGAAGAGNPKKENCMSKQEEASLILQLYELRREDTMRKARDW